MRRGGGSSFSLVVLAVQRATLALVAMAVSRGRKCLDIFASFLIANIIFGMLVHQGARQSSAILKGALDVAEGFAQMLVELLRYKAISTSANNSAGVIVPNQHVRRARAQQVFCCNQARV